MNRKKYLRYKSRVRRKTRHTKEKYLKYVDPFNLLKFSHKYNLDHIYSIGDGFKNNISPELLASPINLRPMIIKRNYRKGNKSHITLEELKSMHNRFIQEIKKETKK